MDNDTISRQAAIEHYRVTDPEGTFAYCSSIIKFLENLPSVHSEQKTGRWIPFDCDTWECSECKTLFTTLEGTPKDNLFNFCPNCDAKMESEEIT